MSTPNDGSSCLEHCDTVGLSKKPSSIDNCNLIYYVTSEESNVETHDTLLEGRDYVLLPQESTSMRSMTVMVFACGGSTLPFACDVAVPKQGRCTDLIHALGAACSLDKNEELKLAEVRNHSFHGFLEDPLVYLSTIKDDDHLFAFKSPKSAKETVTLRLIRQRQEQDKGICSFIKEKNSESQASLYFWSHPGRMAMEAHILNVNMPALEILTIDRILS